MYQQPRPSKERPPIHPLHHLKRLGDAKQRLTCVLPFLTSVCKASKLGYRTLSHSTRFERVLLKASSSRTDDWQLHLVRRILAGYDSILCAGTGYGKSLIFEALALLGGKGKLVIVISPLKALERDQVSPQSIYFKMEVINTDIPGHAGAGEGN